MESNEMLVFLASIYAVYDYLKTVFVNKYQYLFGIKLKLFETVKADYDKYCDAYVLWCAVCKRISRVEQTNLVLMGCAVLMYGNYYDSA